MTEKFMNNSNGNEEILSKVLHDYSLSDNEEIINEISDQELLCDYYKMIAISDTTLTENFNDNACNNERISLAYENLKYIPKKVAEKFATETKFLDLSYNDFNNLSFLSFFKRLHTLILDRNTNLDETTFPYLPKLEILWINNCNIKHISKWVYAIKCNCPNIRYLSMMGNPGAKTLYNGATDSEHNDYRLFVTSILPNLTHLDDAPVTHITSTSCELVFSSSQSLRSLPTQSPRHTRSRKKIGSGNLKDFNQHRSRKKRPRSCYFSSSTT